jgi:hypothetical protein
MVGKADILRTSFENMELNKTTMAMEIFRASNKSRTKESIGIIKNISAANIYKPTAKSVFFIYPSLLYRRL